MAGVKGKSGGKRSGAGRSSLKEKRNQKLISLSDEASNSLEYYSKKLGYTKSDIVDALCLLYLNKRNMDITHCPKCEKPLVWESLMTAIECDVECECGFKTHVGEDIIEPSGKKITIDNPNEQ